MTRESSSGLALSHIIADLNILDMQLSNIHRLLSSCSLDARPGPYDAAHREQIFCDAFLSSFALIKEKLPNTFAALYKNITLLLSRAEEKGDCIAAGKLNGLVEDLDFVKTAAEDVLWWFEGGADEEAIEGILALLKHFRIEPQILTGIML